jgi:hypothetical protein
MQDETDAGKDHGGHVEDEEDETDAGKDHGGHVEDEEDESDAEDGGNAQPESITVSMGPSQEQLSQVSFELNRAGRFEAILVDGAKYRQVLLFSTRFFSSCICAWPLVRFSCFHFSYWPCPVKFKFKMFVFSLLQINFCIFQSPPPQKKIIGILASFPLNTPSLDHKRL